MAKTRDEVVTQALRMLGVIASDDVANADQIIYGGDMLVGIVDELESVQGLTLTWDADTVPNGLYLPVAGLLAVDMSPHYSIAPPYSRAAQIMKIRAVELPDDREDRRDLDDDGTITDEEIAADKRAQYY